MKDLPKSVSIGLPLGSFAFCTAVAIWDYQFYYNWIRFHETSYLEQTTVLVLLPAIALCVWLMVQNLKLKQTLLASWALIMCLGATYYAGEEASWGQNYFGWATPESWQEFNDQGETNIHNTHGIFDQTPRGLLTAGAIFAIIVPPIIRKKRQGWNSKTDWRAWILPTTAVTPVAVITIFTGLPQKLYGQYGEYNAAIPHWVDEMYLRGQHSELKEHFLAMFIALYVFSWAYRFRTWQIEQAVSESDCTTNTTTEQPIKQAA